MSWRHWFREVAVIAAGALAALAAQAWWSDRQDAEREREYIRQLVADTRENERRLDRAIAQDSASGRAANRAALALFGTETLPRADSLAVWLFDTDGAFTSSEFRPLTGTYTALVASGDIRLIRTDTLRARLVAYGAALDGDRERLRFFTQQSFGDVGRMARTLPFLRLGYAREWAITLRDARRFDFARLRNDPEMAAIMFPVQAANANRLGILRDAREETRALLGVLRAEQRDNASRAHDSARRGAK